MTASGASLQDNSHNQADLLRMAMRRMAATVCVISSSDRDGGLHAMTATSITSLSLEPPTILACINQWADLHQTIAGGRPFCINILSQAQQNIAKQCSQPRLASQWLSKSPWRLNIDGLPYLQDSQASIFCSLERAIQYTTHSIFIGLVDNIRLSDEIAPLIYLNGAYRQVPAAADAAKDVE